MRVFVFFLMMIVTLGGMMSGYRMITGRDLVTLSDFGAGQITASAAPQPTAVKVLPTVAPTQVVVPTLTPPPLPTATPVPDKPKVMAVANTDGQGVYLRRTPKLNDRLRAWMEGTKVEVTGSPVDGDGVQWLKVKTPDGTEGYIPTQFLVAVQ